MKNEPSASRKVVIVGAGAVGSTFAYSLLHSGLADEIALLDANRDQAQGQVLDLMHGLPFAPPVSTMFSGEYGLENVCLSVPCIVSLQGVERIVTAKLTAEESQALRQSANTLKKTLEALQNNDPGN